MKVTQEDIVRYSSPGPRYTSYPTYPNWSEKIRVADYEWRLTHGKVSESLSLYTHLPFCEKLCHFCACNRVIDPQRKFEDTYLEALHYEIEVVASRLGTRRRVGQFHWGGGTPTFLPVGKLQSLFAQFKKYFDLNADAEVSIEVHPNVTSHEHLQALKEMGFNRISFGVQDFDPLVQDKINRFQTYEKTADLAQESRRLGFSSLNLDLVYGLPKQTRETVADTIKKVIGLKPDRIALYSFAKVPWKEPFQRRFKDEELPEGLDKVNLYLDARVALEDAGYEAIGMDHFALPHDELAVAHRAQSLHRNFMGYTTKPDLDLVGFGVSAISDFAGLYAQNDKILSRYVDKVTSKGLATSVGFELSDDDLLRRELIHKLMCQYHLDLGYFESKYKIDFAHHFATELNELKILEGDGLLTLSDSKIQVIDRGQILVRNIAMIFDKYLPKESSGRRFSNTI